MITNRLHEKGAESFSNPTPIISSLWEFKITEQKEQLENR